METGHIKRKTGKQLVREIKNKRCISLLREYTQFSTIHGIQHIFREGETWCHSIIWAVLWVLCLSGAVYLAQKSWTSYLNHPIAISITDTQSPLNKIWFPAVALCPSNKMIVDKANEYIFRHVKNGSLITESALMSFYGSLIMLQHPLYKQMKYLLKNCEDLLPHLAHINITALMHYSLPKCEDIFMHCYWRGNSADCCQEIFSLQRSEEGFCYSFNSVTSENSNNSCEYIDAHNDEKNRCGLEKLSSSGPTTGLQIYFNILNSTKYADVDFTGGPKLKVQVFHPNDFPEAGLFDSFPIEGHSKLNVEIKPTVTKSNENIKRVDVEVRGCRFKNEVGPTKFTRTYSRKSCIMECRMAYLLRTCFCLPYYFNKLLNESAPVCNSLQLSCIVNVSSDLRFQKPPIGYKSFLPSDPVQPLSCDHCNPTCNEINYEVRIDSRKDLDRGIGAHTHFNGYIDVYYRTSGAVVYERNVTYDFIRLLVDIGGIAGLFLGGSILSIMEVIYWITKAVLSYFWTTNKINANLINPPKRKRLKKMIYY